MAVHENTLIPLEEAKARQAADMERSRRQWEAQLQANQPAGMFATGLTVNWLLTVTL